MKPIRVITPNFELLGEIDDYESLVFSRRFIRPGEFQLYINANKNNIATLQKNNLIILGTDYNKVGIIKYRKLSVNPSGKGGEVLIVRGKTLSSILGQRITIPNSGQAYDKITSSSESAMKHYVDINVINPTDINRILPNLVLGTDQNRGPTITWQSRYKQLDEELSKIAFSYGIGWDVTLDIVNNKWVFDVIEGKDLTAEQVINTPVIFSYDYDNMKSQTYTESDLEYRNHAYVGGQGEGELREVVEVGTSTGLDRKEVFIDARDVDNTADLTLRGEQKLTQYPQINSFEGEILTYGPFQYEVDWDLGDIVTIQNKKWNVSINEQITEVREIYELGGLRLEVNFGHDSPTLIDKIKTEINALDNEITK